MSDQTTVPRKRERAERQRCLDEITRLHDFLVDAASADGCRIQSVTDAHGGTEMVKLSAERCREVLLGVHLASSALVLMSDTEATP